MGVVRVGVVLAGCLWLSACATDSATTGNWFTFPSVFRPSAEAEATGSTDTAFPSPDKVIPTTITPSEPNDDLSLAKENFREDNYGLAERYFRKAVEAGPRDAEAWLGLAAAYDRLKRFELVDRAYNEVLRIAGPTPEILKAIPICCAGTSPAPARSSSTPAPRTPIIPTSRTTSPCSRTAFALARRSDRE
jgi:tetratricopeptide (TPR) repeat protein